MKAPVQEPGIIEAIFIMGSFAVVTALSVCPANIDSSPDSPARAADLNPAGMLDRPGHDIRQLTESTAGQPVPSSRIWDPEASGSMTSDERLVHHG